MPSSVQGPALVPSYYFLRPLALRFYVSGNGRTLLSDLCRQCTSENVPFLTRFPSYHPTSGSGVERERRERREKERERVACGRGPDRRKDVSYDCIASTHFFRRHPSFPGAKTTALAFLGYTPIESKTENNRRKDSIRSPGQYGRHPPAPRVGQSPTEINETSVLPRHAYYATRPA